MRSRTRLTRRAGWKHAKVETERGWIQRAAVWRCRRKNCQLPNMINALAIAIANGSAGPNLFDTGDAAVRAGTEFGRGPGAALGTVCVGTARFSGIYTAL